MFFKDYQILMIFSLLFYTFPRSLKGIPYVKTTIKLERFYSTGEKASVRNKLSCVITCNARQSCIGTRYDSKKHTCFTFDSPFTNHGDLSENDLPPTEYHLSAIEMDQLSSMMTTSSHRSTEKRKALLKSSYITGSSIFPHNPSPASKPFPLISTASITESRPVTLMSTAVSDQSKAQTTDPQTSPSTSNKINKITTEKLLPTTDRKARSSLKTTPSISTSAPATFSNALSSFKAIYPKHTPIKASDQISRDITRITSIPAVTQQNISSNSTSTETSLPAPKIMSTTASPTASTIMRDTAILTTRAEKSPTTMSTKTPESTSTEMSTTIPESTPTSMFAATTEATSTIVSVATPETKSTRMSTSTIGKTSTTRPTTKPDSASTMQVIPIELTTRTEASTTILPKTSEIISTGMPTTIPKTTSTSVFTATDGAKSTIASATPETASRSMPMSTTDNKLASKSATSMAVPTATPDSESTTMPATNPDSIATTMPTTTTDLAPTTIWTTTPASASTTMPTTTSTTPYTFTTVLATTADVTSTTVPTTTPDKTSTIMPIICTTSTKTSTTLQTTSATVPATTTTAEHAMTTTEMLVVCPEQSMSDWTLISGHRSSSYTSHIPVGVTESHCFQICQDDHDCFAFYTKPVVDQDQSTVCRFLKTGLPYTLITDSAFSLYKSPCRTQ